MKKGLQVFLLYVIIFCGICLDSYSQPKKYNRIVSMSMAGDEMLYDLVDRSRIVALSGRGNNNPMGSILFGKIDDFAKVEDSVEKVIELEPDVVIVADWVKKEIKSQLEDAGINIYTYKTPRTYEEEKRLIEELSTFLEVQERGKEIVEDMDRRLKIVQEKIKKSKKPSPRVLEYSHYEGTNGKGSIFDDMLEKIYAINSAREVGIVRHSKISKEKVIEMDPEVILVPIWDSTETKDSTQFMNFLKTDRSYRDIDAIKEGRVYPIPGKYIYIYSQYIIDGIEELADKVYNLQESE